MNRDKRTLNALVFARRGVLAMACAMILAPRAALTPPLPPSSVPRPYTVHAALTTDDANGFAGAPTNSDPPVWPP